MEIEVSNGELIDKFTILEIKRQHIQDPDKLKNVQKEYLRLEPFASKILNSQHQFVQELKKVNSTLWENEDNLRQHEVDKNFDKKFIELARTIYILNDQRANIKKQINLLAGSDLVEEKSYSTT